MPFATKQRSINFPNDRSLGRLYVSDDFVREKFAGEARGCLRLPAKVSARLQLDADACADLSPLSNLAPADLQAIGFDGAKIDSGQFANLRRLEGLVKLSIAHTQLESSAFEHLVNMQKLRALTIWWTSITCSAAPHIGQLQALEQLDLSRTGLKDEALPHLQRLENLKVLILWDTYVTDAGTAIIAKIPRLEHLALSGTKIGDETLHHLHELKHLKLLEIEKTRLSQQEVRQFQIEHPEVEIRF